MQAWSSGVIEKADVLKTLGHSRIGNTYCIYIFAQISSMKTMSTYSTCFQKYSMVC
jgi:hypothetical protein